MGNAIPGRPLRLDLGQLPKIVIKASRARPVKAGPEGRLGDRYAAGLGHCLIVVGGPADHVDVGVDVGHGIPAAWWIDRGDGSVVAVGISPKG